MLSAALLSAAGARARSDGLSSVEIVGLEHTRASTLLELLPRPAPALYTDDELRELERRIANISIFDEVAVTREAAGRVQIRVREKWTLVPSFDLARGTTLEDTYLFAGATEYNVLGSGSMLGVSVYHERRGFGFNISFQEHVYRRNRWSFGGDLSYGTSELRFPGERAWTSQLAQLYVWTDSTPVLTDRARYEVGAFYKHEAFSEITGDVRPPNGHTIGTSMMFAYDAYQWNDLTPSGYSASLDVQLGVFTGPRIPQLRPRAQLMLTGALRFGRNSVLMARVNAATTGRGNANHSLLLGSVEGVRGVEDALYFNWIQAYANVELRHALRILPRWALQGVVFVDAGALERIDAYGGRGQAVAALSGGIGVRVVPTWLYGVVLRFDVARLIAPDSSFFYQYGLSQYF